MDIYIPFTYLIGWSQYNTFYYGRRTAKNCQPENLWSSYFTSSKYVKEFREEFGEPDIIQIRKTFPNNPKACAIWESTVLKRIDAQHNQKFLNKKNGDFALDTTGVSPSKYTIEKRQIGLKLFWDNISVEKRQEIRNTKINTCLAHYGYKYPLQVPHIREKIRQTCLEKYGFEHPLQSPEIKEKSKQTCLEKYGYEYSLQVSEIRERGKETRLEKYGFEHPLQSPEIKEKIRQTCLEKYGFEHPLQSPEIRNTSLNTTKTKYGILDENITNVFQIEEIKEKIKETMVINYGVTHPSKREKQCSYCGEIKNIQHEAVCQMNINRKMPNICGENNGRANTYVIKSPENEEYEIKLHKGIREFCKQHSLKLEPFMKNKIPGWSISLKEKV